MALTLHDRKPELGFTKPPDTQEILGAVSTAAFTRLRRLTMAMQKAANTVMYPAWCPVVKSAEGENFQLNPHIGHPNSPLSQKEMRIEAAMTSDGVEMQYWKMICHPSANPSEG